MQNIVINTCEKFQNDRLRNDRALANGKSDNSKINNNNKRRTALVALGDPFQGHKSLSVTDRKKYGFTSFEVFKYGI